MMNRWTTTPKSDAAADPATDDLISAVQLGRTDAYAEIVRRYQQSVLRIVNAMLYDRRDTEDLVQQVFVKAYQNLHQYELGRDFGSWIRMIARNIVREELRRASRYDARLKAYGDMLLARWFDDQRSDDYEQEQHASLDECLKTMADRALQVLRLRYYEGQDCEQIAGTMNTSSGAVRNILSRARAQLRECVQRRLHGK